MTSSIESSVLSDNAFGLEAEDLMDHRQAASLLQHAFSPAEVQGDAVPAGTRLCSVAVPTGYAVIVKRTKCYGYNVAGAGGHRYVLADVGADNVGALATALQARSWQQVVNFPLIEMGTKNKAVFAMKNTSGSTRYLLLALAGNYRGAACNAVTEFAQGAFDYYLEAI